MHRHGGILVEHLKNHGLSWDLQRGDRLMWFTTTAWMMWNALVSTLLLRASIVMLDGNPLYPGRSAQWRLAERDAADADGRRPGAADGLPQGRAAGGHGLRPVELRQLCAAGSPLPAEGFDWVYEQLGPDVLLNVGSGGTDVCSRDRAGQPAPAGLPRGDLRPLPGRGPAAFDPDGNEVVGELGELVIRRPMPSMPVRFWNDPEDERYRAAYFDEYPGVWRHGDWILFTERGSCVITGRSDATLNRGGVRLGTAEFYAVVEEQPEVDDSLVVHLEDPTAGRASCCCSSRSTRGRARRRAARAPRRRAALARSRRGTCRTRSTPCRRSRAR